MLVVVGVLALVALGALYAAVVWLRLPSVEPLGPSGDPGPTAFMREDGCEAHDRGYRPITEIDPRLGCAVVWAEDYRYFAHDGVDLVALRAAVRDSWRQGRLVRGASTLPMQLARNLYLTRARHPSRKLAEIWLARTLVARYERLRLLELYLNSAEWAPCVYGAEAAAQHYFGHGADRLDLAEATLLAAMLPRPGTPPGERDGDRERLQMRQRFLISVLRNSGLLHAATARDGMRRVSHQWIGGTPRRGLPQAAEPAPFGWYELGCGTLQTR